MGAKHYFSYQRDWRKAPVAFWVHRPSAADGQFWRYDIAHVTCEFVPPAPPVVPHKGFLFLHVEFDAVELLFSSPAQLSHFVEVLAKKPLPTSRSLASKRGLPVGPNGHWLSRLPASLKSPRKRGRLVESLKAIQATVVGQGDGSSFSNVATV